MLPTVSGDPWRALLSSDAAERSDSDRTRTGQPMLHALRFLLEPPITADPSHNVAKLAWLIRLRWIAIAAQLLAAVPALSLGLLEPDLLPVYASVVALLVLLNLASWMLQRRPIRPTQRHILFQLGADIVALSALLAITGGAWNPMAPILFVHTGLGALLLQGRLSAVLFALLVACLVSIQTGAHIPAGLETNLVPATLLFPAQLTIALVFWILTTWLSRTLDAVHYQFTFLNERKTRVDRLRAVGALAAGLSHEPSGPRRGGEVVPQGRRAGRRSRTGQPRRLV